MDFPLPDTVTYWPVTYTNGQQVFGVGISAAAAIASTQEQVITEQGKEPMISRLAVYTEADIKPNDLVAEGDFDGLEVDEDTMGAGRVLTVSRVPSGTTTIRVLI